MKKVLITGAQGFIGSALAMGLLRREDRVIAVDYGELVPERFTRHDPRAPWPHPGFTYHGTDVAAWGEVARLCCEGGVDTVVHLAGRTGMGSSLSEPADYFKSNVASTQCALEACRVSGVAHFVYASSVAVYGDTRGPTTEERPLPAPATPYAASKRLGELLVESYSSIYGLQATVLRIFSTYGIGQRPETAVYKFARQIGLGEPVTLYGDGSATRDYLYLEDCVDGFIRAIHRPFPFETINIGDDRTITVQRLIELLSLFLGKPAAIERLPFPRGIPLKTHADISKARRLLDYRPKVEAEEGLRIFVNWYMNEFIH